MPHWNHLWALPHWVTVIPPLPVIQAHLALLYKQAKTNFLCLKINYVYECVCCWSGLLCLEYKGFNKHVETTICVFTRPGWMLLQNVVFFSRWNHRFFFLTFPILLYIHILWYGVVAVYFHYPSRQPWSKKPI